MSSTHLEVHLDLKGSTVHVGDARIHSRRHTTTVFEYATPYLSAPGAYEPDPGLRFDRRRNTVESLAGAFRDTTPDRWGRRLIARRIRAQESGTPRTLTEIDFLLGVADATRQGALRFRRAGECEFPNPRADVPTCIRLPELLHASDAVARDHSDTVDNLDAVKLLLDAGAGTLGGARPKASVVDTDERLHIAKFPHHDDAWDVMAWEKTALDLAEAAGITVPRSTLTHVSGRSVLLLDRFDRAPDGSRIGYMSAMTLIGGTDGGHHDYADLAFEIADVSSAADADLEELWRRIAFSIAVNNTDDHMRNHGLLRDASGWRLSPVFDVNPNPDRFEERASAIHGVTVRAGSGQALAHMIRFAGLSTRRAQAVLDEVKGAVSQWRWAASSNGISAAEQERFARVLDDDSTLVLT